MTKRFGLVGLVAAGLALVAGTAQAQSIVEVKVPFPFMVGKTELPAGQYLVERAGDTGTAMLIQGERGTSGSAFVMTMPSGGHDPKGDMPVLTFKRGEKMPQLSEIWQSNSQGYMVR